MRPRDSQRSKVYASENRFSGLARLETISEIEDFVSQVWKSKRLQKLYEPALCLPPPVVTNGRGNRKAKGGRYRIILPRWSRNKLVILHELAHTISMRLEHCDGITEAAHGWRFCSVYLKLVHYFLGKEMHDKLKANFKKHRVRFTEPRRRKPLSPERRAQLCETLAAARLKRKPKP